MIGFSFGVENVVTSGMLFVVTSLDFLGVQKKETSDDWFGNGDDGDEVISFISSASGSQKKERSETSFVHGITGDETSFVGEVIRSEMTC